MKKFGNYLWPTLLAALIFGFGCSTSNSNNPANSGKETAAFASPGGLTATLTNGNNAILRWKNHATVDGGNWVEYTQPGYDYIKLDAFSSDENVASYFHADLPPRTTFIYKIQPFFGRPTPAVEITTGIVTSNNAPVLADGPIASAHSVSRKTARRFSLRALQTFARAMPSDLKATLSSPTSVDLRWKDHAEDEDGCLLEISAHNNRDFVPCALLPPAADSFGKTGLPPQTKCYFRVRAFFYGNPSNIASVTTP
ncbi:MAG: fibronectin type III domain-containing protein [Verrucomicrobiota bacterium]|nr:fibronectin type III domain-containing protein [Verrucomicrobiota bacterium]